MRQARLDWDFGYHSPNPERGAQHDAMRKAVLELAIVVNNTLPECREKSLAITKLEEAMFWANAGIARSDRPEDSY